MSQEARAFARLFMGTSTLFCDVPINGRFHFPTNAKKEECRKLNARGWYEMLDGRRFQTGTKTAVVLIPD